MGRKYEYRFESLVLALGGLFAASVFLDTVGLGIPLLRPVLGFVFLTVGTGGLVILELGVEPELRADWFAYATGCGLMFLMVVAFVLNLVLPVLGYARPLSAGSLTVGMLLATAGLAVFVRRRRPTTIVAIPGREAIRERLPAIRRSGWQVALVLLFPLGSVLSVTLKNATGQSLPLIGLLVAIAVLPVLIVAGFLEDRVLPLAAWSMGLAVLFHKSLWTGFAYGGHASVASVWKAEHWPLAHEVLAPNGLLMPGFARLTGVFVLTQTKVVMPLFVAIIPLALFVTFRRYTGPRTAFLGVATFVFAHSFYYQYPSTPRASIPVLFLVLLGTAISDQHHRLVSRRLMALLFAVGIAVSHYGTSYYVMFALLGTIAFFPVLATLKEAAGRVLRPDLTLPDDESLLERVTASLVGRELDVVRWDFVAFYVVSVVGWYFYVADGSKFEALLERILNAYVSLFIETGGQGATATRLETDYGGLSIELSKYLYVLTGFLVGVGLAIAIVRRLVPRWRTAFDDEYLIVAGMLFFLFGGTMAISGEWGGGRPMMIVLSFGAIFPAVAAVATGKWLLRATERILAPYWLRGAILVERTPVRVSGQAAFAALLAVIFVLNTGVMAAVAYGGAAPSEVPGADPESADYKSDIDQHVWLANHRDVDEALYGDRLARAQTTDWMNGEIAARSERPPYRFKRTNFFEAVNDTELERGYLLMMRHNVEEGRVEVDYVTTRPIEAYRLDLEKRSRIYENGHGGVYFTDNATVAVNGPDADETALRDAQ